MNTTNEIPYKMVNILLVKAALHQTLVAMNKAAELACMFYTLKHHS